MVGGGFAGMPAANTVLENGGSVLLLDKSSLCGGTSIKATSGINGANTTTQRERGIEDSANLFTSDTLEGGAKKPGLAKVSTLICLLPPAVSLRIAGCEQLYQAKRMMKQIGNRVVLDLFSNFRCVNEPLVQVITLRRY